MHKPETPRHIAAVGTLLLLLWIAGCSSTGSSAEFPDYRVLSPFGASYEKITQEQLHGYDLIIVEPNHYNRKEVNELQSSGTKVIAYISLGEVNPNRWYFSIFEERGFLGRNEAWNSYYIDLQDEYIYSFFTDEIVPNLMSREFDGLFLDTIDAVAPYTPRNHLQPRMIRLIRDIRTAYPDRMIIQNAGLFLLDSTARYVDAVLIEDVATHYDFSDQSYALKNSTAYIQKVRRISALSEAHHMPFLIIDFADTPQLQEQAARRLDSLSYPYFINRIGLNNLSAGITGNNY